MELYIKTTFWLGVIFAIVRLAAIYVEDWPWKREPKPLALHCVQLAFGFALTAWAGIVLWYHIK